MTNQEIDHKVLDAIRGGEARATLIVERLTGQGVEGDVMRIVDRSLQRLRKANKIALVGVPRRWRVK